MQAAGIFRKRVFESDPKATSDSHSTIEKFSGGNRIRVSLKRPVFSHANSNRYPKVEILGVFIARHASASRGVNGRSLTGSVTVDKLANEPRLLAC